jgi:hypothetical protein
MLIRSVTLSFLVVCVVGLFLFAGRLIIRWSIFLHGVYYIPFFLRHPSSAGVTLFQLCLRPFIPSFIRSVSGLHLFIYPSIPSLYVSPYNSV